MWGEGGRREEERRLAKDALKMDDAPAQRQLGELNVAPLAYAALGKKGVGQGLQQFGSHQTREVWKSPVKGRSQEMCGCPDITQQTSTCSGKHHNQPWTLIRETELPPPRPALTSTFTDLNINHTFTPPASGCTRMSCDVCRDRHVHASGLSGMRVY